jgi:hypothetical protein
MRFVAIFLLMFFCVGIQAQNNMSLIPVPLNQSGTQSQNALLHLPDNYNSTSSKYPILFFLHGAGEGNGNPASIYNNSTAGGPAYFIHTNQWPSSFTDPKTGGQFKFIVVSPQNNSGWSTSGAQLNWIVQHMVNNYRVDTNRIYVTGLSAGGDGVNQYIAKISVSPRYKVPSAVPMSQATANPAMNTSWSQNIVADSVRTWYFGDDPGDLFGTYAKTQSQQINSIKAGFSRYTDYSGGHCCWNNFYNPNYRENVGGQNMNIYEWMLQYSLGGINLSPFVNAGLDLSVTESSATLNGLVEDNNLQWVRWITVSRHRKSQPGGRSFIVTAAGNGRFELNGQGGYLPGDTIYLSGYFRSVNLENLDGAPGNYIVIRNAPGQVAVVGDSTWASGGYASSFTMRNCNYIELFGSGRDSLKIVGSNINTFNFGAPARTAYLNLTATQFSDNLSIHDLTIRHGGAGIYIKTDPTPSDSMTWFPNRFLDNIEVYNNHIYNTFNEGMYIGHTAAYWNIVTNQPYYPSGPSDNTAQSDPATYKRPLKLRTVRIFDNVLDSIGNDGIQCAAIDDLEVFNNEITDWANKQDANHNGGILIGGRISKFKVYDNYVHDGWGEMIQVYAEGGDSAIIRNNLLVRNQLSGIGMRGSLNLTTRVENNTIAFTGSTGIRINGFFGQTPPQVISNNVFLVPSANYIYVENGASVTETNNKKFSTYSSAQVDSLNFYKSTGAASAGAGYTKRYYSKGVLFSNIDSATTVVSGLTPGEWTFRLTAFDGEFTAQDDVRVTVGTSFIRRFFRFPKFKRARFKR